jgi:hypothetical protein
VPHGLAAWAVAFLVSAALLGNMVAGLASTAASTVGSAAGGVGSMVPAAAGRANPSAIVDRAMNTLHGTGDAPGRMPTEQRTAEISSLLAGRAARGGFFNDECARLNTLVAAEAGAPAEEANGRVQAVEADAQRTATEAARQAREAADATARAASIGAFAALFLGAVAAVIGARRGTREWMTARPAPAVARRPA